MVYKLYLQNLKYLVKNGVCFINLYSINTLSNLLKVSLYWAYNILIIL